MAGTTSDLAVPEEPEHLELTLAQIRARNKPGLWVLLALVALALAVGAVLGLRDIFVGPWQ